MELDPIKYEIFYNRLQRSLTEAKETIRKISCSVITRDAGEVCEGFFDLNGDTVAMAAGLILHVNSISRAIKFMIRDKYAQDIGFNDGDQFINNDPHLGGSHTPDMCVIAPYYHRGRQLGWLGGFTHVSETGAIEPGGISSMATEFYHEGLCMPCVKLVDRSKLRRDVMQMMCRAVRDPVPLGIDTKAKIAGNEIARERISKIIDEFGLDFFLTATNKLVVDAEKHARSSISKLLPGVYKSRVYVDFREGQREGLSMVEIAVEVLPDGTMSIRTPAISPARKTYNNCTISCTEGAVFNVVMTQLFYDLRWNGGTLRALKLEPKEGSVLNAPNTAAVGLGIVGTGMQGMGALNLAFSHALFSAGKTDDILAPCSLAGSPYFGGTDQFGRTCANQCTDAIAGGMGARFWRDGADSSLFQPNPWTDYGDVESTEIIGPMVYLCRRHVVDSGGFGKYRGGASVEVIYLVHNTQNFKMGTKGSGHRVAPIPGLFGGYPAALARARVVKKTDLVQRIKDRMPLPHSMEEVAAMPGWLQEETSPSTPAFKMEQGDMLCVRFYPGGGLGDPLERDPDLVARDIENKVTSLKAARDVYCVSIDPQTLGVNYDETKRLRDQERKKRLQRGVPAKTYLKEMVKKRKNGDISAPAMDLLNEIASFCPEFASQLKFEERFASSEVNRF